MLDDHRLYLLFAVLSLLGAGLAAAGGATVPAIAAALGAVAWGLASFDKRGKAKKRGARVE